MFDDDMPEDVARLVAAAAREIAECAAAGEHPAAAEVAARAAYSAGHRLGEADYWRLAGVLCACEKAARLYAFNADAAAEALRRAGGRLAGLAARAEARLAREECFA